MTAPHLARHVTRLLYDAGLRTYKVKCEDCGTVRGIYLTRNDARAAEAAHRRLSRA